MEKNEKLKLAGVCVLSVVGLGLFLWALLFSQDKMNADAHAKGQAEMLLQQIQQEQDRQAKEAEDRRVRVEKAMQARYEDYRRMGRVDGYTNKNEFGEPVSVKYKIWGTVPGTYMEIVYKDNAISRVFITATIQGKTVWTNFTGSDLNAKFDSGETKVFVAAHKLGTDSISLIAPVRFVFNARNAKQVDIGIPFSDDQGNRTVEVLTFNMTLFNKMMSESK